MASCLFISAADMSDQLVLKGFFYACSFMTPWERVDLNQHFLSQAALGWWMGYLACRAVNNTELADRHVVLHADGHARDDRRGGDVPALARIAHDLGRLMALASHQCQSTAAVPAWLMI